MGKATIREHRYPCIVKANTRICGKKNNDGQSLPRMGKVSSGASRIGFWRYERERGRSSQVDDIREHPSAAEKGSQPRLATLGSPFQGKGLACTLPPSYGRRCPEGAEVGWGKRYERARKIISGRRFTKAPSTKQLIKPIYSYKKRKSNAANDFNVMYPFRYR